MSLDTRCCLILVVVFCLCTAGCSSEEVSGHDSAEAAAAAYVHALAAGDQVALKMSSGSEYSDTEMATSRVDAFGLDSDVVIEDMDAMEVPDWPRPGETMISCYILTSTNLPIVEDSGRLDIMVITEERGGRWFAKYVPHRQERRTIELE